MCAWTFVLRRRLFAASMSRCYTPSAHARIRCRCSHAAETHVLTPCRLRSSRPVAIALNPALTQPPPAFVLLSPCQHVSSAPKTTLSTAAHPPYPCFSRPVTQPSPALSLASSSDGPEGRDERGHGGAHKHGRCRRWY
eukprot:3780418-Pleurochrysis_carterae.AAC.1